MFTRALIKELNNIYNIKGKYSPLTMSLYFFDIHEKKIPLDDLKMLQKRLQEKHANEYKASCPEVKAVQI